MTTTKSMRRWATLAATAVLLAWPSLVSACEGCKSSAQDDAGPNAIGQAFGLSVYFMLAVPMIIVAILVRGIVRRCRELDHEHAQQLAPVAPGGESNPPADPGAALPPT